MPLSSAPFARLVSSLKRAESTCAVIESCCGGLISSSILSRPGASSVFLGGSVCYNTRRGKKLLLNDDTLHAALTAPLGDVVGGGAESDADRYVRSKVEWTRRASVEFCRQLGTDFAISEGGAAGPTFRPRGLTTGFAALAVAARDPSDGEVRVVRSEVYRSDNSDREGNMRAFADEAARLASDAVEEARGIEGRAEDYDDDDAAVPTPPVDPAPEPFLDRATGVRSDPEALASLAPTARYVAVRGGSALFRGGGLGELALLSPDEVEDVRARSGSTAAETAFLGLMGEDKAPVFGVDLIGGDEGEAHAAVEDGGGNAFADLRTGLPLLSTEHNELALHAMALAQWQRRSGHCPSCGAPAPLVDGGTCRRCSGCGSPHWPRQDPSIISVVSSRDGRRVLLARSPRHPPRVHTALAGFVEAGETYEKAVAREAFEETGVRVDVGSVRYVGSQPWPFPQSSMIGFVAKADDAQELDIDRDELVEAGWFDRGEVLTAAAVPGPVMRREVAEAALAADPSLTLLIPPKGVLARTLIDAWLDG